MPPAIPPARLFQPPDAFGAGQVQPDATSRATPTSINPMGYVGIPDPTGLIANGNIPPALSNATDSGDPWINNIVANQGYNPYNHRLTSRAVPMYTLSNGFTSLPWSWFPTDFGWRHD